MGAAIALRENFTSQDLRRLSRRSRDAGHTRRLLAVAEIYDGGSRSDAARIGGVGLQTIRDWVLQFNENAPDGLVDGKAPGQTPKLNDKQRQALARVIEDGPIPAVHGIVRWQLIDPAQWVSRSSAFGSPPEPIMERLPNDSGQKRGPGRRRDKAAGIAATTVTRLGAR